MYQYEVTRQDTISATTVAGDISVNADKSFAKITYNLTTTFHHGGALGTLSRSGRADIVGF